MRIQVTRAGNTLADEPGEAPTQTPTPQATQDKIIAGLRQRAEKQEVARKQEMQNE